MDSDTPEPDEPVTPAPVPIDLTQLRAEPHEFADLDVLAGELAHMDHEEVEGVLRELVERAFQRGVTAAAAETGAQLIEAGNDARVLVPPGPLRDDPTGA